MFMKVKSNLKTQLKWVTILCISVLILAFTQSDEWKAPASAKDKKNPVASNDASLAAAKKTYEKECLTCHGKKGRGDGEKAATLDKTPQDLSLARVQSQTDGELFWKISEGRKPMPANKKTLTEEQRWQLVNYVRTFEKKK